MASHIKRNKKDRSGLDAKAEAEATAQAGPQAPISPAETTPPEPEPGRSLADALGLVTGIRRNFGAEAYGPVPAADRFNRPGHACLFDGIDDYMQLPSDPLLGPPRFTILVTFKMLSLPMGGRVVATQQAGPYAQHRMTLLSKKDSYAIKVIREGGAGYGSMKVHVGSWQMIYRSLYILPERYYQAAVTYTDGILQLAIDGVLKLEQAVLPAPMINDEPLLLGRTHAMDYPEYFHGLVDEVCFFDRPLSIEEVGQLFQPGAPEMV
jgi:hypothetical protein